jgi:lipopolysaccharide export system permease protein
MTKVDRYILRNFFRTLLLWYLCLVGLYVVFDLFTNFEDVFSSGQASGNIVLSIGRYYFFKTFQYFDMLVSLLIMISAMITLSTMIRHNEMIPLLASGISQLRIIMPIIGAAIVVIFLAAACRELILPNYLSDILAKSPSDVGQDQGTAIEGMTDMKTGVRLSGGKAFWSTKTIDEPRFTLPTGLVKYGRTIEAKLAQYLAATKDRPAGFLLQNVTTPKELLRDDSIMLGDEAFIMTPVSHPDWIEPTDCFIVCGVTFNQWAGGEAWRQYGSTLELAEGIRNPSLELTAKVDSVVHARVTQPILDFTLLLLGLPIILSKSDRNVFKALGIGALLIIAFLAIQLISKEVGISYQQPVMGAWFPLVLFVPVAAWLFYDVMR